MATPRRLSSNVSCIGKAGQRKLSSACIGIAGLGGVGGIAFSLLARAGVGRLKIADHGFFEESNANRQLLWSCETDGLEKAKAAQRHAGSLAFSGRLELFGEITAKNSAQFAGGCAAVIDATDSPHSRLAVWRGCKKKRVPYLFASALGERGMLTVFEARDFSRDFAMGNGRKFLPCDHALGPVSNAIGCLAAQQAMNIILKKPAILFPKVLSLDAFSPLQVRLHEF